ncbi:MAG: DNA polymerase domain-containing protein [Methanobacteriaceae archaeon]|nr:DNA polymerase domain-containing protein [Methanobacteriaceae archaeon]
MKPPAKIGEKLDTLLTTINKDLPEGMELELEGYYNRGFFVSKKRYALLDDNKIEVKGLELVRRDWAPVAKNTQHNILKAILIDASPEKAQKIIKKTLKNLRTGNTPLEDLIIHTKLTKKIENYKQIAPHVIAAKRLIEHGQKVGKGSIIQYIITKGTQPISQRSEPIEYIEHDYDPEYYINNQVLPAVLRIFEAIGYSEEQIIYNQRQTTLDQFF